MLGVGAEGDRRQMVTVIAQEDFQLGIDIVIERHGDLAGGATRRHFGEVPLEDEVAMGVGRWILADGEVTEQLLVDLRGAQVVVGGEGLEPQGLAEAARTDEEEVTPQILEVVDVGRAIDVDVAVPNQGLEVCDAVGELEHRSSAATCRPGAHRSTLLQLACPR